MNIVCSLPGPAGAWRRAAAHLGHALEELDPKRPLDAFRRAKPDLVLLGGEWLAAPPVARFLATCGGKLGVLYRPGTHQPCPRDIDLVLLDSPAGGGLWLRPALDALPGAEKGAVRPQFACEAAYVGPYRPDLDPHLAALADAGIDLKVFGEGDYPIPHHVGSIRPAEVADVYASAAVSLDLLGEPSRALAIWAAGGRCLSARRYAGTGVDRLDRTPVAENPLHLIFTIRELVKNPPQPPPAGRDTFADRLGEILAQVGQRNT